MARIAARIVVLIGALALAACATSGRPSSGAVTAALDKVPPTGIYNVDDVIIETRSQDRLLVTAASIGDYSMADVVRVIFCRVDRYAESGGFKGWRAGRATQTIGSSDPTPQVVFVNIQLYRENVPAEAQVWQKDHCAALDGDRFVDELEV